MPRVLPRAPHPFLPTYSSAAATQSWSICVGVYLYNVTDGLSRHTVSRRCYIECICIRYTWTEIGICSR
jgi:hypothetical protein